jgi:hypothetical protein
MPNTLGLDDDLDSVEVVRDIERIFDIRILNEEAESMFNVGQFYDLLLTKIPPDDTDRKCASAMAFYRIRNALQQLGYGDRLNPASDIRALERGRTKKNLEILAKQSGLHMPQATSSPIGEFGSLGGFAIALIGVFSLQPGLVSALLGLLAGMVVVVVFMHVDPGRLPANCETLGGLAKAVAALNYGRLIKMGARHTSEDIWETLVEALAHYALPKSEITRETLFLQSQLTKHASN